MPPVSSPLTQPGFRGTDCEKATAFLEQALGQLTAKQRKPEWHQRNQQNQSTKGRRMKTPQKTA